LRFPKSSKKLLRAENYPHIPPLPEPPDFTAELSLSRVNRRLAFGIKLRFVKPLLFPPLNPTERNLKSKKETRPEAGIPYYKGILQKYGGNC
jgi:hypothetical protein